MTYICRQMAKRKNYTTPKPSVNIVSEPFVADISETQVLLPVMSYEQFLQVANTMPFTQKEWAQILHLSERTLHRYAQNNSIFEGIYADKIFHVQQLITLGLETFSSADAFYSWLHKEKNIMGLVLNFQSLYSTQGIQSIIQQLMRIQYGVYT